MSARVVPDGVGHALSGIVSGVNAAGTTSSTGSVTYPVTVTLEGSKPLVRGAAAAVTVVIASIDDVLTVPTSAVHRSGSTSYVEVWSANKPVRRTVRLGAIGAVRTEIRSGLQAGNRVVLANLHAKVPSSTLSGPGGLNRKLGGITSGLGGNAPAGSGPSVFINPGR
jgi:hypothetical protein